MNCIDGMLTYLILILVSLSVDAQEVLVDDFVAQSLPIELVQPVGIEFTTNGLGFLWEKQGRVFVIDNDQKEESPLIDIRDEINSNSDHGLVGLALDPSFLSNGYIYLYYVVDRHYLESYGTADYDPSLTITSQATIGRITRYTVDVENGYKTLVQNSRKIIIGESFTDGLPILMTSHGVGSLVFGTDGSLLLSFGDGGSFKEDDVGNAQDTYHEQSISDGTLHPSHNVGSFRSMMKGSPNGKILRIDPDSGDGLSGNPYFDDNDPSSMISRVWSTGFRNPYKFMKIPNTGSHDINSGNPGKFLVGDVGSSHWEEINLIEEPGKWYGWPFFEGYDGKWGFYDTDIPNPEAPISNGCKDYYDFQDVMRNTRRIGDYNFQGPCDDLIPEDYRHVHTPPLIAWSSLEWNPPAKTHLLGWSENGNLSGKSILESDVEGYLMAGGSAIPGEFNEYGQFSETYDGKFFFGDFQGFISILTFDENFQPQKIEPFIKESRGITDIKFNPQNGSLYYVHVTENRLVKVTYGGTLPPTIQVSQSKEYGPSPLQVEFDASATINNVEGDLTYKWTLPDGTEMYGETLTHIFYSSALEKKEVLLEVSDVEGQTSIEKLIVSLNNTPPKVDITSIEDGQTYSLQTVNTIPLKADVSDEEFSNEELIFGWQVELHHDNHFHPGPTDFRQETYAFIDPVGCGLEYYRYKVKLTVTDPGGLSSTDTVSLEPYCGEVFAEIIDLDAVDSEGAVKLSWTNNFVDADVDRYVIERSDDYIFVEIGEVNSESNINYDFFDFSPIVGRNLYRVKAYNSEGDYLYSNVAEIIALNNILFKLYPNPVEDELSLIMANLENLPTEVSIVDMMGRLVYKDILNMDVAINSKINVSALESGIYYIMVGNTNSKFIEKFVKL